MAFKPDSDPAYLANIFLMLMLLALCIFNYQLDSRPVWYALMILPIIGICGTIYYYYWK